MESDWYMIMCVSKNVLEIVIIKNNKNTNRIKHVEWL